MPPARCPECALWHGIPVALQAADHLKGNGMTMRRNLMTTRCSRLAGLAVLVGLTACAAPAAPSAPAGVSHDMLEGKTDGGFFFQRALEPQELTFQQGDQAFDPSQYVAYWFQSTPGPVELTTWRDYGFFSSWGGSPSMTHVLFEWNPKGGSDDMTDGNNWSLLRENSGTDSAWHSGDVDTIVNLPDDTRYLLVVLGTDDLYTNGVMTHTKMTAAPSGDSTPGGLLLTATYSISGDPAVGLEVSVGTQTAATDDNGTVTFFNLPPSTYTVKLGPGGYMHVDMTVQPAGLSTRVVELDHPLGDSPPPSSSGTSIGSTGGGTSSGSGGMDLGCDPVGPNDTKDTAGVIRIDGTTVSEKVCSSDDDWFEIDGDGQWTVTIDFDGSAGDLDMEAVDSYGNQLGVSNGSGSEESVDETGPFYVHVYGYAGATNAYTLTASSDGAGSGSASSGGSSDPCASAATCGDCTAMAGCGFCPSSGTCESGSSSGPTSGSCGDWQWTQSECSSTSGSGSMTSAIPDPPGGNDTRDAATVLSGAASVSAQITSGDDDWYEIDAVGSWTATIDFDNSMGDLDMEAVDTDGNQLDLSNGSGDEETVTESGPFYVHVYGYSGATNTYTLTVE